MANMKDRNAIARRKKANEAANWAFSKPADGSIALYVES